MQKQMYQLSIRDMLKAWEDRARDIFVSHEGHAFYLGGQIAEGKNNCADWVAIRGWMNANSYYPNVWVLGAGGRTALVTVDCVGEPTIKGEELLVAGL